jgi:hypothetical protein
MIPDEIIRRRIPPAYGDRKPHSEFIDASFLDLDGYFNNVINASPSENIRSNGTNRVESQRFESEENTGRDKMASPKLFPGSYVRRIASDQAVIASDIRKYLLSNHVNPLGNSCYFENRRRLAKFSYSF